MPSRAFQSALFETGFFLADGSGAPGLIFEADSSWQRLRPVFSERIGLQADAVFCAQNAPTTIFKDAGNQEPSFEEIQAWHEAAWNVGLAPILWIVTPNEVRLYDCYSAPRKDQIQLVDSSALEKFSLQSDLSKLASVCGRFATETGAFWSNAVGKRIDRRFRVDRELLKEINALEQHLTEIPPSNAAPLKNPSDEIKAARDFAQRLIGRCIFASYLLDRNIAQPFFPPGLPPNLSQIFGSEDSTFALFDWLRETFNGDLFPMDDPGAEHQRLGQAHLDLLRNFVDGVSLVAGKYGQGRLFRFRFEAIPIDLISAIYQQFARSSAEESARVQGLHYTPIELVHLALDPVFEGLPSTARVIDPTCGSGAFLVEAFRRLVWKNTEKQPASRGLVRDVLYEQLFGMDINKSALGIAAFSLYLAALELDEEPVHHLSDLKFDRLIGRTLFRADTTSDELPAKVTNSAFDAVIGNPPWTYVKRPEPAPKSKNSASTKRVHPRRSPDHEFLAVAAKLAGKAGRIGMVMKASPFYSRESQAIESREDFFKTLAPVALVNISALRKDGLFPDSTGPALLFFSRYAYSNAGMMLVGSIPWSPDFRRSGVFSLSPADLRTLKLAEVLRTPAMLKAATFGTTRDGWLVKKLENTFETLDEFLNRIDILNGKERGQGFQVEGDLNDPPENYYEMRVVTPEGYRPFRLVLGRLQAFHHTTLHRPRNESIFRGPLVLCPKGISQSRRYSGAFNQRGVLYTENFYGISFAGKNVEWARLLTGILNSSITTFQLALGGGAWGLERPTVEPKDLLSLRIPDFRACDVNAIRKVLEAEGIAARTPDDPQALRRLDEAVFRLYALERDETVIARESVFRAQMITAENNQQRQNCLRAPEARTLANYANEAIRVVNAYLKAGGNRHLEAEVFMPVSGLCVVKFMMASGSVNGTTVRLGDEAAAEGLVNLVLGDGAADPRPYINEKRQIRIYLHDCVLVVKPAELRYWTRSAGLVDADAILADHWMRVSHASGA